MGRFTVIIGKKIHIENVVVAESDNSTKVGDLPANGSDTSGRGLLLRSTIFMAIIFLCGAAGYGMCMGEFSKLEKVWAVVAPLVGG